ncbi:phage tail tape measure protein [Erwinia amylovora]|uniref:phage tail tape measure protein n=1 Tax=Erwinia amylovora TaxID=552 RepID=UPI000C06DFD6|nr:phage tail tape measure protein [Erwinia amylovora]
MATLRGALALIGGPAGAAMLAGAAIFYFYQKAQQARQESIAFAAMLPDVIRKLKEMNLAQAQGARADTVTSINNQKNEIADLQSHIADLNKKYNERITLAKQMGGGDEKNNGHLRIASDLANELAQANRDLNTKVRTLNESQDALRLINIQVNEGIVAQMKAARDGALALAEAEKKASFLGQTQSFLAGKLGESTAALQKFNAESLKINWGGSDGEKLIKQAERRLALSKVEG